MYVIGLTGGIAAGKSTVARRLVEHGVTHIDADQLARIVVAPGTPGLQSIRETFGAGMLNSDGSLNRAALGALVFADGAARAQLNDIVHPAVRVLSDALLEAADAADPEAIVVYDVPLLVEAAVGHPFDVVVVAHAPVETRIARMVELRGMSEADAAGRIAAQASDADRLAIADVVIDTDGTLQHTLSQVDALFERVSAASAQSTVGGAP
ncbi:dephospho-CoA kinase [Glaciibacter psychrotolerans]|uniref:Dephospho-CoA kinase n=1 Tax=Glaciibacter psychrotolerans TaxID=670054 RepID=A0A7Z0EEB8_9MICO|nr:dephospho-CoA kinase [Leifsonia psychrotolerans]